MMQKSPELKAQITVGGKEGSIVNGRIKAAFSTRGKIMMFNSKGGLLLEEYARNRRDLLDPKCATLEVEALEFKPIPGGNYHLTLRLESVNKNKKIYGMWQYQQGVSGS